MPRYSPTDADTGAAAGGFLTVFETTAHVRTERERDHERNLLGRALVIADAGPLEVEHCIRRRDGVYRRFRIRRLRARDTRTGWPVGSALP
jgi:hypothetical protein